MRFFSFIALCFALSNMASADFEQFGQYDASATAFVDHDPMDQILKLINVKDRNVDKVAFSRLQGRTLDYVEAYIQYLEAIPVSRLNKNEQLAYWLNLHNVTVLHIAAANRNGYKKIKRYRGTLNKPGSEWIEKRLNVEGQHISLFDIEQNILPQHWQDPLFIYGLDYGVRGSPNLHGDVFTGKNVQARLEENARRFINSKKNVKVKRRGIELSSLYEWHRNGVFGGDDDAIIEHISSYAKPRLQQEIGANREISKYRFDWKSVAYIQRSVPFDFGSTPSYRGAGS